MSYAKYANHCRPIPTIFRWLKLPDILRLNVFDMLAFDGLHQSDYEMEIEYTGSVNNSSAGRLKHHIFWCEECERRPGDPLGSRKPIYPVVPCWQGDVGPIM